MTVSIDYMTIYNEIVKKKLLYYLIKVKQRDAQIIQNLLLSVWCGYKAKRVFM